MELQLPGRPSELEKAGVPGENQRTQTGDHHALSYTNKYMKVVGALIGHPYMNFHVFHDSDNLHYLWYWEQNHN